jgi:hypothetical protein
MDLHDLNQIGITMGIFMMFVHLEYSCLAGFVVGADIEKRTVLTGQDAQFATELGITRQPAQIGNLLTNALNVIMSPILVNNLRNTDDGEIIKSICGELRQS